MISRLSIVRYLVIGGIAVVVVALLLLIPRLRPTHPNVKVRVTAPVDKPVSTSEMVKKVIPAVVSISSSDGIQGSGVVVDANGVILTCYHVVNGARDIVVKMTNGGYFPVQGVVSGDKRRDIAFLSVKGKGLPYLRVMKEDTVEPGDKVIAITSPKGLENTVSEGIVSAIRRVDEFPSDLRNELLNDGYESQDQLLQFTAPVSPGSSGGPLIDSTGEVVGIVARKLDVADNVYLAIPGSLIAAARAAKAVTTSSEDSISNRVPSPEDSGVDEGTSIAPAFTPGSPPEAGRLVRVSTPKGFGVNLRESASQYSPRIAGREMVANGERLRVLGVSGDWAVIRTEDGYEAYVRWWYQGRAYVRPE